MKCRLLAFVMLMSFGAQAAPLGTLAYLRAGAAWVEVQPGKGARQIPDSAGARLLAVSPTSGAVAFMAASSTSGAPAAQLPSLRPFLSQRPYTVSQPLDRLVPDSALKTVRARWLTWEGDGRNLIAGTDAGTVAWDLVHRKRFIPNQTPGYQSTSQDGDVTAAPGTLRSPDEPGVLLYGPGARPGTELFSVRETGPLMAALRTQPQTGLSQFLAQLDPARRPTK
ncbi:hypothetical protein ACFSC4_16115 [Deinococcus malanensis]|uniref:hypothetical protein n=1 Tax=Deinococcus malanensis TaxID=1706855 RepID=UPI0036343FFF